MTSTLETTIVLADVLTIKGVWSHLTPKFLFTTLRLVDSETKNVVFEILFRNKVMQVILYLRGKGSELPRSLKGMCPLVCFDIRKARYEGGSGIFQWLGGESVTQHGNIQNEFKLSYGWDRKKKKLMMGTRFCQCSVKNNQRYMTHLLELSGKNYSGVEHYHLYINENSGTLTYMARYTFNREDLLTYEAFYNTVSVAISVFREKSTLIFPDNGGGIPIDELFSGRGWRKRMLCLYEYAKS